MITYLDCQRENELRRKEAIRCRECGGRILYKKRTRRCILEFHIDS